MSTVQILANDEVYRVISFVVRVEKYKKRKPKFDVPELIRF
ncbi:MAG: hypothetical protein NXH80_00040 [Rhodobacteraceae bacterium]|nr:hypothetical protein [Paracoccaceae bacterium]